VWRIDDDRILLYLMITMNFSQNIAPASSTS